MALAEEVVDEYKTSLADLNFNSKPLINMLTMLAEDHEQHAPEIVKVIEDHLNKCKRDRKLPALYLMDSIMKNLEKSSYRSLFSRNVVQLFTSVFEQKCIQWSKCVLKWYCFHVMGTSFMGEGHISLRDLVDEKTRASMFKLRQTWSSILPNATMYRIDKKINSLLDPAWPITATEPEQTSIHVNPRFLQGIGSESERSSPEVTEEAVEDPEDQEMLIRQQLIEKQQELLRLKQARLELELAETAEKLRRKPGAKGQPSVASSTATPLGLPMPSLEDSLPLPEIAAKPRDPRPRPTDPRRRDPRLQNQVVSSPSSAPSSVKGSESVVASLHGHGALPNISSVPVKPVSSRSTFPPVSPPGPYPVGQIPPAGMMPFNEPALGGIPPYNGLQGPGMPYQPMVGMPPNIPGQVFSGEVFIPEDSAKFSDENDSDSSRSSVQGQNNTKLLLQPNIRDPRHRNEPKRNKGPRVEHRSSHHEKQRNVVKQVVRHASDKQVSSVKDSHRQTKDPRLSSGRETQEKRKSKDREMNVPSKQAKEPVQVSPRKSASSRQVSKHGNVSKERDSKSETKLKDTSGADRKWKEEEIKRIETKVSRKSEEKRPEKPKERTSREREKLPQQSAKQYSNRSRDMRVAEDRKAETKHEEKKDPRTDHKKSDIAANRKGNNKTTDRKIEKSKVSRAKDGTSKTNVEPMDIDERVRPAKEAEKRLSSDREIHGRIAKRPKLEQPLAEPERYLDEKTSELNGKRSNVDERMTISEEQDVNIKEEDMDIVSEPDTAAEADVPKIDDDLSELFGMEDEDYRPAVQKHQLPLKSPSNKGWDRFKASQPDQYAYDIELKKQRQDSVVENTPIGEEEEPQDEDLRVHQPEFQQQRSVSGTDEVNLPEELAMNQHADIFLEAHKQLKEGSITQEQHQELLKQLGALMQIQKLQEENRRLSSEMIQQQEVSDQNCCLSSEMQQPKEEVSSSDLQTRSSPPRQLKQEMPERNPVREVISPERPIDTFKIPKKTVKERADENDRRKELSNLYPESPQEDRYRGHGPFTGRDNQNRQGAEVPSARQEDDERERSFEEGHWKENQEGWEKPLNDFNERRPSSYRQGKEMSASPQDTFDAPPEHRGPRSGDFVRSPPRENVIENYTDIKIERQDGPPDNFDGRMGRPDGPPDNFDGRRPILDGPPENFDGRMQRPDGPPDGFDGRMRRPEGPPDGFDGRRSRPDGPPDGFDGRRPGPDGQPDDFNGRRPRPDGPPDDFDGRRPIPDGPPDEFDGRRPRPDGPPDNFDGRRPRESEYEQRGPPDRFEPGTESRGPYRERRSENWPERRGPDDSSDQRGQWNRDFDRRGREDGDRRNRNEGPEFFNGPPDIFPDEDSRRPGKPDWKDSRRSDKWRDQDDANFGKFEKRGSRDRFPESRGPAGRFREGRHMDQRGPNEPDDFPKDGRGGLHDHPGRDRTGRPHDRRGGPPGDRRPRNGEDSPDEWENSSQGTDNARKHRIEGPFGRPGPPSKGSKPWFPPGEQGDSPKKEPWGGHPDKKSNDRQRLHSRGRKGDRHDEEEYEPAFIENAKPKPLMSLLDPLPPRPPPGLRGTLGDPRMQGPGPRGPQRFDGPGPNGPSGMNRATGPFQPQVDTYVDKFGDPRFRCFVEMGPEVTEEVVIGKRNFEIKLGAPPRKIAWGKDFIEVFADPSKRGVVIDQNLMYKFGERVKDVTIRGRKEKLFYHGRPLNLWIEGQHYEVRVDAPPKSINIEGKVHKIQIDGRDMMILIDKEEKGGYGGVPRFVFIDDTRKEIRFDPPPRHILIDGNPSELKLNMQRPCINIKGVLHGIRFDGPPRDVFVDGKLYQIFTDHAVKIRVGNRFHYVALGGPCHEIIVDGKWFEMKFNEAPKEIDVGNQVLMVRLPGNPPEVKILPEIAQEPRPIPPGMQAPMRPPGMMPGPGPMGFAGPRGPNMGPGMPMPGVGPPGIPPMQQPAGLMQPQPGPMQGLQMNIPMSSAPSMPMSGPPMIPGIGQPLPAGAPGTQPGMPNVLSSLFPSVPSTSSTSAPIDIKNLFAKLVNTGIIKKEEPDVKPDVKPDVAKPEVVKPQEYIMPQKKAHKQEKFADIPDMREMKVAEMKSLPVGMVQRLYSGIQCTSCGERFLLKDGEKTEKYRQHLDWHFRQNRKGKTDMKLDSYRKWYYPISDWMQYEEVTDTKETGKSNFFEQQQEQQQQQPVDTTPAKNPLTVVVPEGVSAIKCPAATGNDNEDICNICREVFEQYWDEELEEWHLRDAIKVNNKTYHPICYGDQTDVSEGTPSPSALSITEPGFVSRKSLAYDEASQDGHHASFEEERKISTSLIEPMDTSTASESSAVSAAIKTEPSNDSEYVGTMKIKLEQETEVMSHDQTDSVTQSEKTESHMVVVKQEPPDVDENLTEHNVDTSLQQSVEIKIEPVDGTSEQESDKGPVKDSEDEQTPMEGSNSPVTEIAVTVKSEPENDSESAIPEAQKPVIDTHSDPEEIEEDRVAESEPEPCSEPKTHSDPEEMEEDRVAQLEPEPYSEPKTHSDPEEMEEDRVAQLEPEPYSEPKTHSDPEEMEEDKTAQSKPEPGSEPKTHSDPEEMEEDKTAQSEPEPGSEPKTHSDPEEIDEDRTAQSEPESDSEPKTNTEISTSGIHVSTSSSHLAPPDDQEVCETQHSPTYSKLNKINLVIPPQTADITPEVLEIGSNASTPTQDELPSPPGQAS